MGDRGAFLEDWRTDVVAALGRFGKRSLDLVVATLLLVVLLPLIAVVAAGVRLDGGGGPVFARRRRLGYGGREFGLLRFRTTVSDGRASAAEDPCTRFGRVLTTSKLGGLPQLWNVVRGELSLVGPPAEEPEVADLFAKEYRQILRVRPGITGLSQLAFPRVSSKLLPARARIDCVYVSRRSFRMDLNVLLWTAAAALLRLEVAVHRQSGRLTWRRSRSGFESGPARSFVGS